MKKHTKILALLLAFLLVFPLSSCGSKNEKTDETAIETESENDYSPKKREYVLIPAATKALESEAPELYGILKVLFDAQKSGYEKTSTVNTVTSDKKEVKKRETVKYSPDIGKMTDTEYFSGGKKELSAKVFAGENSVSLTAPELFSGTYGTDMGSYGENMNNSVFGEEKNLSMNSDLRCELSSAMYTAWASGADITKAITAIIDAFLMNSDRTDENGEHRTVRFTSEKDKMRAFYKDHEDLYRENLDVKKLYYAFHGTFYTENIFTDTPDRNFDEQMYDYVINEFFIKSENKNLSDSITAEGKFSGDKLEKIEVLLHTEENDWGFTVEFSDGKIAVSLVYPYLQLLSNGAHFSPDDSGKSLYVITVDRDKEEARYTVKSVYEKAFSNEETEICSFSYKLKSGEYIFNHSFPAPIEASGTLSYTDDGISFTYEKSDLTDGTHSVSEYSLKIGNGNFEVPEYTDFLPLGEEDARRAVLQLKKNFIASFFRDSFNYYVTDSLTTVFDLYESEVDFPDPYKDRAAALAKCFNFLMLNSDRPAGLIYKSEDEYDENVTYFDMETVRMIAQSSGIKEGSYLLSDFGNITFCDKNTVPEVGYLLITFENYIPHFNVAGG